jgi:hypothetical protein
MFSGHHRSQPCGSSPEQRPAAGPARFLCRPRAWKVETGVARRDGSSSERTAEGAGGVAPDAGLGGTAGGQLQPAAGRFDYSGCFWRRPAAFWLRCRRPGVPWRGGRTGVVCSSTAKFFSTDRLLAYCVEQFGGGAHGARLSFGNALSRLPRCPAPLENEALQNSFREARKKNGNWK